MFGKLFLGIRCEYHVNSYRANTYFSLGTVESPKLLDELFDTKSDHYHSQGCFNHLDIFSYNTTNSEIHYN